METAFRRIGIYGVGLIGGSLGLALKRAVPQAHILGIGRSPERLRLASDMGVIDTWQLESEADLSGRDLIILATPVDHIIETLRTLGPRLGNGAVVTDAGSTKRRICGQARSCLPSSVEFIGGHPIAGKEFAGVGSSTADLFQGAPFVLCPGPLDPSKNLDRLCILLRSIGARPLIMTAEEHDRGIARVSHLPQLLSTALANLVSDESLRFAGSGFRDMTRLAGSPYAVWESILETNCDNVDEALAELTSALERMRRSLKSEGLAAEFAGALRVYERLKPGD
jgi:prephenate dehydrogenase